MFKNVRFASEKKLSYHTIYSNTGPSSKISKLDVSHACLLAWLHLMPARQERARLHIVIAFNAALCSSLHPLFPPSLHFMNHDLVKERRKREVLRNLNIRLHDFFNGRETWSVKPVTVTLYLLQVPISTMMINTTAVSDSPEKSTPTIHIDSPSDSRQSKNFARLHGAA